MKRLLSWLLLCTLLMAVMVTPSTSHASITAAPLVSDTTATDGMIRVWLASISNKTTYNLTVSGTYTLNGTTLASGTTVKVEFSGGAIYMTVAGGTRQSMGTDVTLYRSSGGVTIAEALSPTSQYPGNMRFFYSGTTGYIVCTLYLEEYVYGVLPHVMSEAFPLEALKAQAIAARTYGVRAKKSSGSYDVTDMVNHQVFNGVSYSNTKCIQATDATKGIVVTYNGSYIDATYSGSNGGQTELGSNAWGSAAVGYLTMKTDGYDLRNPNAYTKTATVPKSAVAGTSPLYTLAANALATKLSLAAGTITINSISAITLHTPKFSNPSQLYTQMKVTVNYTSGGAAANAEVDILIFPTVKSGLALGINTADNELLTVTDAGDRFVITSRRYGHGVGMSQRGAQQMANEGLSYAQILGFYYTGVQLVQKNFQQNWSSGGSSATPTTTPSGTSSTGRVSLQNPNSRLNMRQTATASGAIVARLAHGTTVTVLGTEGDWYYVQYGNLTGYVAKAYIVLQQTTNPGSTTAYITIQAETLAIREEAKATATVLGYVHNGATVTVLESGVTWSKIKYGDLTGYVMTQYLSGSGTGGSATTEVAVVTLSNTSDNLNLRSYPSTSAPIVAKVPHGTALLVLEKQTGWTKVSYQGQIGYVANTYIRFQSGTAPAPTAAPTVIPSGNWLGTVTLTSGNLNLRSLPNTTSQIVGSIPNGTTLGITQLGDDWCQVLYGSTTGYVARKYLTVTQAGVTPAPSSLGTSPTAMPTSMPTTTTVAQVKTGNGGPVNIRQGAATTEKIIGSAPNGAQVQVISTTGQWTLVQYVNLTGYIYSSYLIPVSTATVSPSATSASGYVYVKTVSGGPVNLRETAASNGRILALLPYGTQLTLLKSGTEWTQVSTGTYTGYVATQYLTNTQPTPLSVTGSSSVVTVSTFLNSGVVNLTQPDGFLSVYASPDEQSAVVTTLINATALDVLEYRGTTAQWLYVRSGSATGYVLRSEVKLSKPVGFLTPTDGTTSVALYAAGSDAATVLGMVPQGSLVTLLTDTEQEWIQVRFSDGIMGFVREQNVIIL